MILAGLKPRDQALALARTSAGGWTNMSHQSGSACMGWRPLISCCFRFEMEHTR
jgi:hypothetical protein